MRATSRDEQDVLTRLGVRYRNFAEVERDLAELDGQRLEQRRREYLEQEQPPDDQRAPAEPPPLAPRPSRSVSPWASVAGVGLAIAGILGALVWLGAAQPSASASLTEAPAATVAAAATPRPATPATHPPAGAVAPSGIPILAPAAIWSGATCTAAIDSLANDAEFDRAEASYLRAHGSDPKFPTATAAYYEQSGSRWDAIRDLVKGNCGQLPGAEIAISCQTALDWLGQGAAAHDADLGRAGISANDAAWDRGWAAFYRSLSAELAQECVSPHA